MKTDGSKTEPVGFEMKTDGSKTKAVRPAMKADGIEARSRHALTGTVQ